MIKLKEIVMVHGETTLVFDVDFPDGSIREVIIDYEEIMERLRKIRELKGSVDSSDLKAVIKKIINDLRRGKEALYKRFSIQRILDVDLEAETT